MTLKRGLFAAGALLGLDITLSYVAGMAEKDEKAKDEKRKNTIVQIAIGQTVLGLPAALALLYGSGPYA